MVSTNNVINYQIEPSEFLKNALKYTLNIKGILCFFENWKDFKITFYLR